VLQAIVILSLSKGDGVLRAASFDGLRMLVGVTGDSHPEPVEG